MSVPLVGVILFPLCMLFWRKPERLLEFMVVAGVFQAASALTIGGLCLQPTLVPGLAFLSYVGLQRLLGATDPGQSRTMYLCGPMIFNGGWALLSSIIMPRLFENAALVWPQKKDGVNTRALLAPSFGNISQDFYLLLNVILLVMVAQYLTRPRIRIERLYYAYMAGSWIVVFVCFWQFGARVGGLPFPHDFFYSNTAWTILDTQTAGPVPRINASFTEPAACATYLTGIIFSTVWITLKGYKVRWAKPLIAASTLCLCLTTSTTGFAAIAVGAALLPIMLVVTGAGRLLGRVGQMAVIAIVIAGLGSLVLATFVPKVVTGAATVVQGTAEKKESASYKERSQQDADSVTAFFDTYGLGTGWGSNRSSSLIPGLMASVGVIGMLALAVFDWRLMRSAGWAIRAGPGTADCLVIEGFLASVIGRVTATTLSAPTLGLPDVYATLGIIIAAIVRVQLAAVRARRTVVQTPQVEALAAE